MAKPIIRRYNSPTGGWGALEATGKALAGQGIALSGSATLLKVNQPEGFDCPGCAWPYPKHTSAFEFCENGAKAVDAKKVGMIPPSDFVGLAFRHARSSHFGWPRRRGLSNRLRRFGAEEVLSQSSISRVRRNN
jgi:hypothetical protein